MEQGYRYESERRNYERADQGGRWSPERGGQRARGDERWSESGDEGRQGPLRYGDRYGESPYGETRGARGGSYAAEWSGQESRGYRAEPRRPWNGGSDWDDDRGRFEGAVRHDNGGSSGRSRDYDDTSRSNYGDGGSRYANGGGSYGSSGARSGGSSMSAGMGIGSGEFMQSGSGGSSRSGGYGRSAYGSGAQSSDWRGQGSYGPGGYGQSDWGQSGQGGYSQGGYGQGGYRGGEGGWRGNIPMRGENGGLWGNSNAGSYGRSATQERGRFRGKGPKNYRRSDERIKEDVSECLTDAGEIDASMIEVEVSEGEVTLKGTVNSREEKRLAESLLDGIAGVKDVTNQLRVSPSNEGESSSTSTYSRKQDQGHSQGSTSGQSTQPKSRSSTTASNS